MGSLVPLTTSSGPARRPRTEASSRRRDWGLTRKGPLRKPVLGIPALIAGSVWLLCQMVYWVMSARHARSAPVYFSSFRNALALRPSSVVPGSRSSQHRLYFKPEPHKQGPCRGGENCGGGLWMPGLLLATDHHKGRGDKEWCGRPGSNRHRPFGPTDFRTRYGFRRRRSAFGVWTIPSP